MIQNWRLEFVLVAGVLLLVINVTQSGALSKFWGTVWG